MGRKTIPEQEILICDRCERKGVQYKSGAFQAGGLHIRKAELWGAAPNGDIGGGHADYDLCAQCAADFDRWLKEGP